MSRTIKKQVKPEKARKIKQEDGKRSGIKPSYLYDYSNDDLDE
jgi:hypothetical protein